MENSLKNPFFGHFFGIFAPVQLGAVFHFDFLFFHFRLLAVFHAIPARHDPKTPEHVTSARPSGATSMTQKNPFGGGASQDQSGKPKGPYGNTAFQEGF